MEWYFDYSSYLILLLLLPLLGFAISKFLSWKKSRRILFAEEKFQEKIFGSVPKSNRLFSVLYLSAFLFLVIAIADVLSGSVEIKSMQKMNNVIFLLDVSNSMNAEDLPPSRLVQAQNIMMNTMARMTNDKVGIVIFAGEATSIMPLTTDYNAAETYLSSISTNMMKVQGTDFLKGIETTAEKFKHIPKGARKVIILSDGEDNEGNEARATKLASDEGISVISVGIGSEEGAPIPEYVFGQLMGYKQNSLGETVVSKRESKALQNLASKTGGDFIDGNNLEQATDQILESLKKRNSAASSFVKSENAKHYYQYFLGITIFLFFILLLFNQKKDFNL